MANAIHKHNQIDVLPSKNQLYVYYKSVPIVMNARQHHVHANLLLRNV